MEKKEILLRLEEIQKIKKSINLNGSSSIMHVLPDEKTNFESQYKDGISVIIPTYKGEGVILQCLNSLYNQNFKQELFDIIIVINGEEDSTRNIINDFIQTTRMINITILDLDRASASLARNKGIAHADRTYTLFLDDDDYISNNYLEELHRYSTYNTIAVSQIVNIDENGNHDKQNAINKQIVAQENDVDFRSLSMVSTINACKLIPTHYIKGIKYDPNLYSGEDIVFFVELYIKYNLKFKIIPIYKQVYYFRCLRSNSVSRREMTFDFYIKERLEVINRLDQLLNTTDDVNKKIFIKQKIDAQSAFINKYISENIHEREQILNEVKKYKLAYTPYSTINKGLADSLIISYCFPPYMDTSGNVMAKRIRSMEKVVDVIYNKMDRAREKDDKLNVLVDELIENRFEVTSSTSFSNWKAINEFSELGMNKINGKKYEEIYSRALWPGSHFLAYKYKKNNQEVKWVAEFSDPILHDVQGKVRQSDIEDSHFMKEIYAHLPRKFRKNIDGNNNLFFWCEYLAYVHADELIFTNENQLKYMIESFPIKSMKETILNKSTISSHPTLPKDFYYINKSKYVLDEEKVNIAYFGAFYQTRNLDDVFLGLKNLDRNLKKYLKVHIFTSKPALLQQELKESDMEQYVDVNPYVSYNEFLNLTTIFDCLVVNDAVTKSILSINPFLPSKLSDYIGSDSNIWAIYEKGSVLSSYQVTYKSELGNIKEATNVFEKIVNDKIMK